MSSPILNLGRKLIDCRYQWLSGVLLAALSATTVWSVYPLRFRAIHVVQPIEDILLSGDDSFKRFFTEEQAKIRSNDVLNAVARNQELRSCRGFSTEASARRTLGTNLTVRHVGAGRILIEYTHADPESAALICDAITKSYLEQRQQRIKADIRRHAVEIEQIAMAELNRVELETEQLKQRIRQLSREQLGYDPGNQFGPRGDRSSRLHQLCQQIAGLRVRQIVLIHRNGSDKLVRQLEELEREYESELRRREQSLGNGVSLEFARMELEKLQLYREALEQREDRLLELEYHSFPTVVSLAAAEVPVRPLPSFRLPTTIGTAIIALVIPTTVRRLRVPATVARQRVP